MVIKHLIKKHLNVSIKTEYLKNVVKCDKYNGDKKLEAGLEQCACVLRGLQV